MAAKLTNAQLLEHLKKVTFEEDKKEGIDELSRVSMADSLLMLAELDHESEYNICRAIAQHLLGEVPEPDDADLADLSDISER
jgi:hypothetical protein